MTKIKNTEINVGEDMEQKELSSIVVEDVKWATLEGSLAVSYKIKHKM
jgi:hypothetical protein